MKSRKQPVLNLELAHHVSTVAHLGNIAFRTGKKITWDAVREKIVGDHEAEPKDGKISVSSPIARALIGKSEGDEVLVRRPAAS